MSKKIILLLVGLLIVVSGIGITLLVSKMNLLKPAPQQPNKVLTIPLPSGIKANKNPNIKSLDEAVVAFNAYASIDERKLITLWMQQGLNHTATPAAIVALIQKVAKDGTSISFDSSCAPSSVVLRVKNNQAVQIKNDPTTAHTFALDKQSHKLTPGQQLEVKVTATRSGELVPFYCDNQGGIPKGFFYLP